MTKLYHLIHGAVTTPLSQKSIVLFENNEIDDWGLYRVTDAYVLIRHRTTFRESVKSSGRRTYTFPFNADQVQKLFNLNSDRPLHLALVCCTSDLSPKNMEIALIHPMEWAACVGGSGGNINVAMAPRACLRVSGPLNKDKPCIVPCNRLENWDPPGTTSPRGGDDTTWDPQPATLLAA